MSCQRNTQVWCALTNERILIYLAQLLYLSHTIRHTLALINAALFAPAFAVALYYHIADPKHAFDFRKLFTDSTRVQVGVFTMLYNLFTYCSYQLLPITLGVPLFMTFPLMIIALSPWVKGTAVPTWQESVCIGVIAFGLGGFFLHAATKTTGTSTSHAVGLVLGVLGAVSMALRMLYTAQRPTAAPVRAAVDVQRDDPEQTEAAARNVHDWAHWIWRAVCCARVRACVVADVVDDTCRASGVG